MSQHPQIECKARHNLACPLYTGWYILSHTIAILHIMVRQGDAPAYYLRVILLIRNILTRITEVMSVNKLGKMCDVIM